MPMEVFMARFKERDLAEMAYNHHETVRKVSASTQSFHSHLPDYRFIFVPWPGHCIHSRNCPEFCNVSAFTALATTLTVRASPC